MMSPPMTFMIDGKQYIAVAGGPGNAPPPSFGEEPAPAETKVKLPPSHLLVYALDGKAALPKDLTPAATSK
jgi:hypothetical protein